MRRFDLVQGVVCVGSAVLLAGCQAPAGGALAVGPGRMARSDCGPYVIGDGHGNQDVLPSGDKSGDTDPQDIQCALSHMSGTGTTTLDGTDFYLAHGAFVTDVQGTLRGLGRDTTTLHALDDFDADLCGPGDSGWTGAPSDTLGPLHAYVVAFFYDPGLYAGALTVTDLAVEAEGDAVVYCDHGRPVHDGVKFGVVAIADVGLPYEHFDPNLAHDIDFTYEHLKATGTLNSELYMGSTLGFPFAVAITTSGDVKMGDIVSDGVGNTAFAGYTEGAHIVIGGSDRDAIVTRNNGFTGVGTHVYADNDVEFSHVEAHNTFVGALLLTAYPGNTVSITDNTMDGARWAGAAAVTYDPDFDPTSNSCCSSVDISHNVISGDAPVGAGVGLEDWNMVDLGVRSLDANVSSNDIDLVTFDGGIYDIGTQDAVVSNNTISGQMVAGIYASPYGEPVQNCALLGNNVQNVQSWSGAQIFLGGPTKIFPDGGTKDCAVVGDARGATVIDDGQDNLLTGVTNLGQGQILGSDVQDAMASRRAELSAYDAL